MLRSATAGGQILQKLTQDFFFGDQTPSAEEIEAEHQRQLEAERQRAERERLERIEKAAQLRSFWDGRDQAVSEELDGVFNVPRTRSSAFFGIDSGAALRDPGSSRQSSDLLDSSMVDLRGTSAGDGHGPLAIQLGSVETPLGGPGMAFGSPIAAPPANPRGKNCSPEEIESQIRCVQAALRQLDLSMQLDASQRREWEQISAGAVRQGWAELGQLAAGLALDKLISLKEEHAGNKVIELSNEELPLLRRQLDQEFKALEHEKKILKGIETGGKVIDSGIEAAGTWFAEGAERREQGLELSLDIVDLLGKVPHALPLDRLRNAVDSTYAGLAQYYSYERFTQLDRNWTESLRAQKALVALQVELYEKLKSCPTPHPGAGL